MYEVEVLDYIEDKWEEWVGPFATCDMAVEWVTRYAATNLHPHYADLKNYRIVKVTRQTVWTGDDQ